MAWGQLGLVKHQKISNGTTAWGTGGIPVAQPLAQTGIVMGLRNLTTGTPAFTPGTGTIAVDKNGPFNVYTLHTLVANAGPQVFSVSGYGNWLIGLLKRAEQGIGSWDVAALSEANAGALGDVYGAGATSGTAAWRLAQDLPITQRVRGLPNVNTGIPGLSEVGGLVLQNPSVQFTYNATPNSASQASAYNIYSLTAGQAPYLVTGNATVTLATPTIDLMRSMYQVPANPADMPYAGWQQIFVPTWTEQTPQGASVNGASTFSWKQTPVSGLLTRLLVYVFDGGTGTGVASSSLSANNALMLTYDNGTVIQQESAYERLADQFGRFGFAMPQGMFVYDFMGGRDLTLTDALDTQVVANITFTANLASALGSSNSAVKILPQVFLPVQVG